MESGLLRLELRDPPGYHQTLGHVLQGGLVAEEVVVLKDKGRPFSQPHRVPPWDAVQRKDLSAQGQGPAVRSLQQV